MKPGRMSRIKSLSLELWQDGGSVGGSCRWGEGGGSDEMSCDPAAITRHPEEKVEVDTPLMLLWNGGVRLIPFEKSKNIRSRFGIMRIKKS